MDTLRAVSLVTPAFVVYFTQALPHSYFFAVSLCLTLAPNGILLLPNFYLRIRFQVMQVSLKVC